MLIYKLLQGSFVMKFEQWSKRMAERTDITGSLVHLTKGVTIDDINYEPVEVLLRILSEQCLKGSTTATGFIIGNIPAVCFQDAPISSISQNCHYEHKLREQNNSKIRYEAYGIRFPKEYVYQRDGRPVIYDKKDEAKKYLNEDQWWRIVNFYLYNHNYIIDWTHEREWRVPNYFIFETSYAQIILPNNQEYKRFINLYKERFNTDPFYVFSEIINMSSYLF